MNFGKGMGLVQKGEDALLALVSNYGWEMNFKLEGYNECLITYVMAVSSPTHPIAAAAYHKDGLGMEQLLVELPNMEFGDFNYNGATGNVGPCFGRIILI
jgi:hypothetical protein